jgi:hypothetical protein
MLPDALSLDSSPDAKSDSASPETGACAACTSLPSALVRPHRAARDTAEQMGQPDVGGVDS